MKKLLVLLGLVICACAPAQNAGYPYKRYVIGGNNVYEFRLEDGTQCVFQYNGGLACNWEDGS